MTNAEKYEDVFGFKPDVNCCPAPTCEDCPVHDKAQPLCTSNWWNEEYIERKTILRQECLYREPIKNKYIIAIDNGSKMLKCPKCECQIIANPFSYAVGSRGYSFCPYCGEDLREEQITIDELL